MDWKRRRTLSNAQVKRVAIVGGTHGNESNGVQLAKHFERHPEEVKRPSFEVEIVLSNTAAITANTRYVEEDLNRCFLAADLADNAKANTNIERKRAREVDAILGPKNSADPRCDFIIDLHNTTAATDVALLMAPDDAFAHELSYHLMSIDEKVRVVNWNDIPDWFTCPSVGRSGMTFEVGPCSWGCVVPELFQRSRTLVIALLDYIEAHNERIRKGDLLPKEITMPVFKAIGVSIDYPRDDKGDLIGMVHPDLQGNDFKELCDGDNLFATFDGKVIPFNRKELKVPESVTGPVYALFVNEAAYYEKKMALMLVAKTEKKCSISC